VASFTCNICGAPCERPAAGVEREGASCSACGSSMRERALAALVSSEIFGIPMTLPEFPPLKGIRAIGMSDSPGLAARLAEKFDYTNTFYHQSPLFDLTHPDDRDFGRYDFILSSEVLEHVPPPMEAAFATLARLLKPDGLLLMTTPYRLDGKTEEHFPELYQYTLASPGGRTVLVNRRRDGQVETFENLVFHGGHGSTLELRFFTEQSLRETLTGAGFAALHAASESYPEFGVEHSGTWSLPMAARKGRFVAPPAELAREYREACRRAARAGYDLAVLNAEYERHIEFHNRSQEQMERELDSRLEWVHKLEGDIDRLRGEYERYIEFHNSSQQELERELGSRTEWARKLESDFEERTRWALDLAREKKEAIAAFEHAQKSAAEAWECVRSLEKELDQARAQRAQIDARLWTRLGRKLGTVA
jgi:SAM-dependent methyltransferase